MVMFKGIRACGRLIRELVRWLILEDVFIVCTTILVISIGLMVYLVASILFITWGARIKIDYDGDIVADYSGDFDADNAPDIT